MSLCPFKLFSKCGGGHLKGGSSCHFLSHPLTFGILGCMPCTSTGSGMTTEGILLDKGTWGRDTEGYVVCTQPPLSFFSTKLQDHIKQDLVWFCFFYHFLTIELIQWMIASCYRGWSRSLGLMLGERGGEGKIGRGRERTWNLVSAARGKRAEVFILNFDGSISAVFFLSEHKSQGISNNTSKKF